MKITTEMLSAYLDGELSPAHTLAVENALQVDEDLRRELEKLQSANNWVKNEFAQMLDEPVSLSLANAIKNAPPDGAPAAPEAAAPDPVPTEPVEEVGQITQTNQTAQTADIAPVTQTSPATAPNIDPIGSFAPTREQPGRTAQKPERTSAPWPMAAALAFTLIAGSIGGYFLASSPILQSEQNPTWLTAIAQYHGVYAAQGRHLVEVSADESDHLRTWLSAEIGEDFTIPDLSAQGLNFEGGRLLVAAGKPVAQLMYKDQTGAVIALCLMQGNTAPTELDQRSLNGLDLLSWTSNNRNIVLIGDSGQPNLRTLAQTAAQLI